MSDAWVRISVVFTGSPSSARLEGILINSKKKETPRSTLCLCTLWFLEKLLERYKYTSVTGAVIKR